MVVHTLQIRQRFVNSLHARHSLLLPTPASDMSRLERKLEGVSSIQNQSQFNELRNCSHGFESNFMTESIKLSDVKAQSEQLELRNSKAKRMSYRTVLDSQSKLHCVWFRVNSNCELKLFDRELLRFEAEIISSKAERFIEFTWNSKRNY